MLDLKIMFLTALKVLKRSGVSKEGHVTTENLMARTEKIIFMVLVVMGLFVKMWLKIWAIKNVFLDDFKGMNLKTPCLNMIFYSYRKQ